MSAHLAAGNDPLDLIRVLDHGGQVVGTTLGNNQVVLNAAPS